MALFCVLCMVLIEETVKRWYDDTQFRGITVQGGYSNEPEKQKFPDSERLYTG